MIVTTQKANEIIKSGGQDVYLYSASGRVLGAFTLINWKSKKEHCVYLRDPIDGVVIEADLKDLAIL